VRRLIADNPFATLISVVKGTPVASRYPVLLEAGPALSLVTHVGRPEE
jgi:transcriptional regulator